MNLFIDNQLPNLQAMIPIEEVIVDRKTAYQHVFIFRNEKFGTVLALDGTAQVSSLDEFFYHEMLVHPAMAAHPDPKSVLVIGGGDGGALKEVLKHRVERAVLADIDGELVALARQHLTEIAGSSFDDPRVALEVGDGAALVAGCAGEFDVIVVDTTDPLGNSEQLFGARFYQDCRRALRPGGILVSQAGIPLFHADRYEACHDQLAGLFQFSGFYFGCVPLYVSGHLAFCWGALDRSPAAPSAVEIADTIARRGIETRYYNAEIHAAAFAMPNYLAGGRVALPQSARLGPNR